MDREWEKEALSFSLTILIFALLTGCSKETASDNAAAEKVAQSTQGEGKLGKAPDFTLPKLEGGDFTFSSLESKVIILNFWATWCPPCRKEIPSFIELYNEYRDKGLEIVGVCLDEEAKVKAFAKKVGINYILVIGDREVAQRYGGIRGIPTTFIIDRQGDIVKKHVGYAPKETFEKDIKGLLSK